jgi:nucleotide-binding universal stress UspA family protein
MTPISRILCPIDFSDFSRHALDYAVAIARRRRALVTALHVVPPPQSAYPALGIGAHVPYVYSADDLKEFQKTLERFVADAGYPVTAVTAEAAVVAEILTRAAAWPADLIVLGTHGRTGFDRLLLGSVTERVLARASCPVLTVPRRAPEAVPFAEPLFINVLCPTDFSPSSMAALEYAEQLVAGPHTRLTVLHVAERLPAFQLVPAVATGAPDDPLVVLEAARTKVHRVVPQRVRRTTEVEEVVSEGRAADEILICARTKHADLIVMGAHARGAGLLGFGSTTNDVIRAAECPVLTLRA